MQIENKTPQPALRMLAACWFGIRIGSKDEKEDLRVLHLATHAVDQLRQLKFRFLRIPNLISRVDRRQQDAVYLVSGFPKEAMTKDDQKVNRLNMWRYLTVRYEGDNANVDKYDPELHLAVRYLRESHSDKGVRVHPPGMSGCGIWQVNNPFCAITFGEDDFKLTAIQTCWHKGFEYAKGTWVDVVMQIVWKYFPEVRQIMMLHGVNYSRIVHLGSGD